jgi:hypothetical protein
MKACPMLKSAKVPSLLVALALQVFPISRVFIAATPGAATSSFAIVSTWVAGIAAMLGSYDTVSGGSTTITSPETAVGTNGTPFAYRITTGPDGANIYNAEPLPSGLVLSTTSGRITGTPLEDGVFNILLTASDHGRPKRTVTQDLALTIRPGPGGPTAPTILTDPSSRTATNGGMARFSVTATGSGPLRYSWRRGENPLVAATNSNLVLTGITTSLAGEYSVVVSNGFGSAISASASLTVLVRPFINTQPISQTAVAGTTALFAVEAGGTLPLTYQWRRNGASLAGQTDASLLVTNVGSLQAGAYSVVVSNAVGSITSAPVALTITQAPATPLSLMIVGSGSVSPLTDSQFLEVGKSYTIKATPGAGNVLSNWVVAGQVATGATLTFTMSSNLDITANFVSNPFVNLKGSYSGLYYPAGSEPPQEQSGAFTLVLTDKGAFSSKLVVRGLPVALSGSFGLDLAARKTVVVGGTNEFVVQLQLASGSDHLVGIVSNASFTSDLFGYRTTFNSKLNPATNITGKYTMMLNAANESPPLISGSGVAAITVASSGSVLVKGALADGTPLVQKAFVAANGQWPFFANLYKGKGSALGWLTVANTPTNDISGLLLWTKKEGVAGSLYQVAFTNEVSTLGSRYVQPAKGIPVLSLSNAVVVLSDGNLSNPVTASVVLSPLNTMTVAAPNPEQLALTVSAATGLLNGSFVHPETLRKISIRGVVLEKQNLAGGYFLGTNESGRVMLAP